MYKIFQIKEIEDHIDKNSLIAFDLDDTLITAMSYYGSGKWEENLVKKFQQEGLSLKDAFSKACSLWEKAQTEIKVNFSTAKAGSLKYSYS